MGTGIWGTTISQLLSEKLDKIFLWGRNEKIIEEINNYNKNTAYLNEFILNKNIVGTTDDDIFNDASLIFIVIPSQSIRAVINKIKDKITNNSKIIICSKGIENETHLLMSEVINQIVTNEVFFLSGPNFAKEIIRGLPSFANLAGMNVNLTEQISNIISTQNFKVKPISDICGAQISAALKNVFAILCGILNGKKLGLNCQAAIITSALHEIKLFCKIKDSQCENLLDFCGIGDLILTCYSENSRNMQFGKFIAEENNFEPKQLSEGLYTLKSAYELAQKNNVEAKITQAIYRIVYEKHNIDIELRNLFSKL
jgi:glycerol-3-phosphate dehydrogenase (NAD(P)+)